MFITVEGTEGVGKSSNMAFIAQLLAEAGQAHILTREPGGTPMAESIRSVLVDNRDEAVSPMAELLLIFASRAQHLFGKIQPALQAGSWVVCDRFTDATYAYQGAARGLGAEAVAQLETLVQGNLRPDLTLLLDAPVEIGMSRAGKRGQLDRFEQEKLTFFCRVRQCYLDLAAADPTRYFIVDASQPLAQVQEDIRQLFGKLLAGKGR